MKIYKLKRKPLLLALAGYVALMFVSQLTHLIRNCIILLRGNHDAVSKIVLEFNVSDWLINYEGSFVRRGFMGEILYWIYECTHVNIPILITLLSLFLLLLFSVLFVRNWMQYRLSIILLPSFVLLGGLWGG